MPGPTYGAATGAVNTILELLSRRGNAADLLAAAPAIFADYFYRLWPDIETDYSKRKHGLKQTTIQEDRALLRFREVARKAKVIEDPGQPVIVSCDTHGPDALRRTSPRSRERGAD